MVATRTFMPYAAVLAAALTLGACSGGDPAPPSWASTANGGSPTSSSSGSVTSSGAPSSSAGPTGAEDPVLAKIPKEARAETAAGAEAFVKFYLDSYNQAMSKPDPSATDGLYAASCKGCAALRDNALQLERTTQRHAGATISLKKASTIQFVNERKEVEAEVVQNPVGVVDASGNIVRHTRQREGLFLFTLIYQTGWKVTRLQASAS